jgi:glyoxylase-like metal-dependent hydrolase (beta-lactamase superfamily II)
MRVQLFERGLAACALLALGAMAGYAQQPQQDFSKTEIKVLPVQGNVYMLVGVGGPAGGNITVQAGSDGVFVVDTMYAPLADKIVAAIRTISQGPIRYIVNTHVHGDHTGGNEPLRKAGSTISGGNVSADIKDSAEGAQIIAHQNILNRMSAASAGQAAMPSATWPTDTYMTDEKDVFFNNEGIQVIHIPAAHTDGDSIVFFRRSDVISTGDLFTTTNYPVIDLDRGGSYQGFIAGLQKIVDMIIPVYGQEGGTMVIPGHGRLCDLGDVLEYREMAIIIRDRVQDMVNRGMTLEQVKAAKPTIDYDPLYGSTTGFWTTDKFVEAVYKSLKENRK